MANRNLASLLIASGVVGLWCAVMLIPIEWPLSVYQHENSVFNLGPVSADVRPGQSFAAHEPFDVLAAPVQVGGPLESVATLTARVRSAGPSGASVSVSAPVRAVSTERAYQMVHFRFPETVPAGDEYFVEFDIPRVTRWPIYLAAIAGDKYPDGQLFMQGAPTLRGQDLVYQLLRRQSIGERIPTWWHANRGSVVVGIGLLVLLHLVSIAAIHGLPLRVRRRLPQVFLLGFAPPALLGAANFALFFLVL